MQIIMKNIFLVLAITTILILGVCVPIKACYVGEVAVVVCPDGSISTGMAEYDADCGFLNLKYY